MPLESVPLEQLNALVDGVNGAVSSTMDIFSTYILALLGGAGLFPEEVVKNLAAELQAQIQKVSETYRQQIDSQLGSLYRAILACCQDFNDRATLSVTRNDLLISLEEMENQLGKRDVLEKECIDLQQQLAEISALSRTVEELRVQVIDLTADPVFCESAREKTKLESEIKLLKQAIQTASKGDSAVLPETELLRNQIENIKKTMSSDSVALVQDYLTAEHELSLYSLIEQPINNNSAPSEDEKKNLSQLSHKISILQTNIELKRAENQTASVYIDKIMELKAEEKMLDSYISNPTILTDNIRMLEQSIDVILKNNPTIMQTYTEKKQLLTNIEELRQMVQFPTNGLNENVLLRKQYQEMAANHPDIANALQEADSLRFKIQKISNSTLESALFECTNLKQELTDLETSKPEISLLVKEQMEYKSIVALYQQAHDNNNAFVAKINQEKETLGMLEASSPDVKLLVDVYRQTHSDILAFKKYLSDKGGLEQDVETIRGELTMLIEGNPDVVALLSNKDQLKQELKSFGDSLANIKALHNEVEAMRVLKEELKHNNPEVERLIKQKDSLEKEVLELNGLANDSTALEVEVCELEQELQDLHDKSSTVINLFDKRAAIQQEIQQFKSYVESPSLLLGELVKSQEELASIKENNAETLSMMVNLEKLREEQIQIQLSIDNKSAIEADYVHLHGELETLKETHGHTLRLLNENNTLRTQIMDIREGTIDFEALQEDNYRLQEDLIALKVDYPEIESTIQDKICLLQQINDFQTAIGQKELLEEGKKVLLDKMAELKTLNPDLDSLITENERLKESIQTLEENIKSKPQLEQENNKLIIELDNMKQGSPEVIQLLQSIKYSQQELDRYKQYISNPEQLIQQKTDIENNIAKVRRDNSIMFDRLKEIDTLQQKLEADIRVVNENHAKSNILIEQIAQLKTQQIAMNDSIQKSSLGPLLDQKKQLEREIAIIEKYSNNTEDLRAEIASLNDKLQFLKSTNSAVTLLIDEKNRITNLIDDIKSGNVNEKTLSDDISRLQTELFTIKSDKGISHLVNEVEHLKLIVEEMRAYKDNPTRLEARQKNLAAEVATLRECNPQIAQIIDRIEETTVDLNALSEAIKQPSIILRKNANLVDQLTALKQNHSSLFNIVEENKCLQALVNDISTGILNADLLGNKKNDLQARLDTLMKSNPQLQQVMKECDDLSVLIKKYEYPEDPKVVRDQLETEKHRLQKQLEQLQQDNGAITTLSKEISNLHDEIDTYIRPGALEELQTRRDVIQNNLLELKQTYPMINNCLLEIEDLTILCDECRAAAGTSGAQDGTALQTRIDNLRNVLDAFKSNNYQLSTMIDKILSLKKELKEFKSQIGQEEHIRSEIETLEAQLMAAHDSNATLSAQMRNRSELSQALQEFRDYSINPALLQRQIASLSNSLDQARQTNPEVAAAILERQYLEDQLTQFADYREDTRLIDEVAMLKRELASLKKTYTDATSLIEERDALRALIHEIEATAHNPEDIEKEHSMLYSKFSSLITSTKEFLLLKAENDALRRDILALNKQMAAMDDIIAENVKYEQEIADLRTQAETMTTKLSRSMLDASQTLNTISQQKDIIMTELERQKDLMDKLVLVDLPKAAEALNYRASSTGSSATLTPSRRSIYA